MYFSACNYESTLCSFKLLKRIIRNKILLLFTDFGLTFFIFVLMQALATVKRTPAYKNRLKALELERTGGVTNKKKGPKQIDQYAAQFFFKLPFHYQRMSLFKLPFHYLFLAGSYKKS